MKKAVFRPYLHSLAFSCIAVVSPSANSQQSVELEEVIVTGTRIVRKDIESVSPVTVTTAEEIKQTGVTRIEDMMNQMPQVETSSTAMDSNGATGNASLDLRGLGSNRTLVLVNGHRLQSGGLNSIAPDLNQIPTALVKNVEVLTGGASTVYGSDAVAGVVNFIIDDKFEGFQISASTSGYQHNNRNKYMQGLMDAKGFTYPTGKSGFDEILRLDGTQQSVDLVMGGKLIDDNGHITAYANYRTVDSLLQGARDYSGCALKTLGTSCGGSGTTPLPNFYLFPIIGGSTDYNYELDKGLQSDGTLSDAFNTYNYAPINYYQRPDKRWSLGGFADYKLSDRSKAYMEFNYMQDRTVAQIAESGTFFNDEITMSCDSPLLSASQRAAICDAFSAQTGGTVDHFAMLVGKRNVEGGPRQSQLSHNSMRVLAGIKGDLSNNWKYDASYQVGVVDSGQVYVNDLLADRVIDALDVVADPVTGELSCASGKAGCIPYQVFTPGAVTKDQADSLGGTGIRTGNLKQTILSGYLTGNLPVTLPAAINPIALVAGVEQRTESYQTQSDFVFAQGLLLGQGGPKPSVNGSYTVREAYAESVLPLIEGKAYAQNASLEFGIRTTNSSITSNSETWKVGLNYRPNDVFKLRAGFNKAIRSPNVYELFEPQNIGLWEGVDNCAGSNPKYSAAQCLNTGLTSAQYGSSSLESPAGQYNALYGGQVTVKPEEANTYTIGFVVTPSEKLNITADYWDIKVDGFIDSPTPDLVIDACAETGSNKFCSLIHRSTTGSLWLGKSGYVDLLSTNLGYKHYRGLDVGADYSMSVLGGNLDLKLQGTHMLKKFTQEIDGLASSEVSCVGKFASGCYASPRWRHNLQAMYSSSSAAWSAGLRWRYYGAIDNLDETVTGLNAHIGSQSYLDIPAVFKIGASSSLNMGINNILDKEPPLVGAGANPDNANSFNIYDTLGRYVYANLTMKF